MAAYTRYRIWFRDDGEIQTKIASGPDIKTKADAIALLKEHYPDAEIGIVQLA
jgi:hypothetical protein